MNEIDMHIIKAIKSNFCMNHYNPIYVIEQKSILETVFVMHLFIDGVVVVNGKYIYYGMHIFFMYY